MSEQSTANRGFAKLWGAGDSQILAVLDDGDKGPEVRIYSKPAGMGVCNAALQFGSSTKAWDLAKKSFEGLTEAEARKFFHGMVTERLEEARHD